MKTAMAKDLKQKPPTSGGFSVTASGFKPETSPIVIGVLYSVKLHSAFIFAALFHFLISLSLFMALGLSGYSSICTIVQSLAFAVNPL
jgi:hypothetical protein